MQHAGLQYGQGAVNSHQSPPFAHTDIPQSNGGTTTSSLRQFRKKDGTEKNSSTDLSTSVENSHIARVPPHNHYPARPNDYYRYQPQYTDYNLPYKETPAQVKYSEIAETPPQSIQHVDHIPTLQKHKDVHKDFMDMCNISQQTHMKQNYPDNLTRQQSYPPDAASVHHQYLHKEPQVHPAYKPESQYQQYPQIPKYNMPSQCRKYPPPPQPENDFLAKLQRINPSMARSIMSDHHIRESQTGYPSIDQSRMYPQNQRYYPPTHLQNNLSYNYQPYNYPSSCNYKHPEYPRTNQMAVGGAQYPSINPHTDRSLSPRNIHMMNYGNSPQKISPNYSQYNPPEYAQHYQHRRASLPQEYYQQACRANAYMAGHQISESADNRAGASAGLRHFIENWAEEEGSAEIAPIFKENIRIHNNDSSSEQVFVINSSDIPQCLENVSLVPTENGQYIIKTGALDNSVVRIKETTETNGERTVNLQIVEAPSKPDCMLAEEHEKTATIDESISVPYQENQKEKDCDEVTKTSQPLEEQEQTETETQQSEETQEKKSDESSAETSVIVSNEVSVIKDMPIIDLEEHAKNEENAKKQEQVESEKLIEEVEDKEERTPVLSESESTQSESPPIQDSEEKDKDVPQKVSEEIHEAKEVPEENHLVSTTKRTQRIFSVDDIINNIGNSPPDTRRNSLQFVPQGTSEEITNNENEEPEETNEEMEYRNAISVEEDSVILEIGGAWVQLNINELNGTKILSVLPLSESLVIDVNGNYQAGEENSSRENLPEENPISLESNEQGTEEDQLSDDKSEETTVIETSTEEKSEVIGSFTENLENDIQNEDTAKDVPNNEDHLEDIDSNVYQSEVVIGEESLDNEDEVFIDLNQQTTQESSISEEMQTPIPMETTTEYSDEAKKLLVTEPIANEILKDEAKKPLLTEPIANEILEDEAKTLLLTEQPTVVEIVENETQKHLVAEPIAKKVLEDETEIVTKESLADEEMKKPVLTEMSSRRDERRKSRDSDDKKKSSRKIRSEERRGSEERLKSKKIRKYSENDVKTNKKNKIENLKVSLEGKREVIETGKKKDSSTISKIERRLSSQTSVNEEDMRRKERLDEIIKPRKEKKLTPQSSIEEDESKKKVVQDEIPKLRRSEKKLTSQVSVNNEDESKKKECFEDNVKTEVKTKRQEKKVAVSDKTAEDEEDKKRKHETIRLIKREKRFIITDGDTEDEGDLKDIKLTKKDKKLASSVNTEKEEIKHKDKPDFELKEKIIPVSATEEEDTQEKEIEENSKLSKKEKKLTMIIRKEEVKKASQEENVKPVNEKKKLTFEEDDNELKNLNKVQNLESVRREKKLASQSSIEENEEIIKPSTSVVELSEEPNEEVMKITEEHENGKDKEMLVENTNSEKPAKELSINTPDVVKVAEEMITLKLLEEIKDPEKLPTKAAKKLYVTESLSKERKPKTEEYLKQKRSMSKLEETVNKIKSLKEKHAKEETKTKKTSLRDTSDRKSSKVVKKVTFNLEAEIREISKEEIDKKKLSLEEYNSRKRKASVSYEPEEVVMNKIMEDTVTSSDDINDEVVEQVAQSIESAIKESPLKKSPPRMTTSNWEEESSSPGSPDKDEVMSTTNRKCIIDVNEFSIKPIESVSTPSPVSSSQFSYHSEEDSLQVYKDVVDSKLNSLNIKIPKLSKPKPVDRFSVLLDRFLNKGSLNYEELEEVKKFIEIKRKMMAEEKKLTYEVRGERDYKDLKLHFRKVPEKRKKKRFRNLYAEDTSDDSDSSRSEQGVGNYSVYQRDSQGVPKLIFKRKSGLPQPFVKLERSQAVELLAKKRKLY